MLAKQTLQEAFLLGAAGRFFAANGLFTAGRSGFFAADRGSFAARGRSGFFAARSGSSFFTNRGGFFAANRFGFASGGFFAAGRFGFAADRLAAIVVLVEQATTAEQLGFGARSNEHGNSQQRKQTERLHNNLSTTTSKVGLQAPLGQAAEQTQCLFRRPPDLRMAGLRGRECLGVHRSGDRFDRTNSAHQGLRRIFAD
jgi:hypothetical protein